MQWFLYVCHYASKLYLCLWWFLIQLCCSSLCRQHFKFNLQCASLGPSALFVVFVNGTVLDTNENLLFKGWKVSSYSSEWSCRQWRDYQSTRGFRQRWQCAESHYCSKYQLNGTSVFSRLQPCCTVEMLLSLLFFYNSCCFVWTTIINQALSDWLMHRWNSVFLSFM